MAHRLLLDVSSLMYRAHFAVGETFATPGGRPIGALYGYLDMVTRLIGSRHPDEVVHAYDHEWRPVARTDLYAGYKSNRPPDPDGLPEQFTMLRQVLDLAGIAQAQTRGWEAEDAIAALCAQAKRTDRVEIVSGDRDLIQLVRDPVVKLLFTVRGVTELLELDESAVLERYGVPASRYAEFAILRGDPSDDLPGVRGVGEKTARALVQTYDSLDEMLADAAAAEPRPGPLKGKPALRARLRDSVDYVAAMKALVPVNVTPPLDRWQGERDDAGLDALSEELGIGGPVRRLRAATGGDSPGAPTRS